MVNPITAGSVKGHSYEQLKEEPRQEIEAEHGRKGVRKKETQRDPRKKQV